VMPQGATTPRKLLDDRTGLQRFLDSAGIPRHIGTLSDVGQAAQNLLSPQASPTDPGFGQTLPVVGPIFRAQRETYDQPGVAAKVYGSLPLVGPPGYRAGQQLESGDYAGAAGSALNILTQILGMKPTNLSRNIGNATQEAGNLAVKAAPAAGKAADIATTGAGVIEAINHGDPRYLLSALLHRKAGSLVEGGASGLGSFLQKAGSSINPDTPAQFGNPAFSSASIGQELKAITRAAPIRGDSQTVQTFSESTPAEIAANAERIAANRAARQVAPESAGQNPVPQEVAPALQGEYKDSLHGGPLTRLPSEASLSGESALRQVLTGQDNGNLMRIAKSRGINVTKEAQLKPGIADKLLVEKIVNDFSPDELDEVGNKFMQNSRFGHSFGDIPPEASNAIDVKTYFPDVKLPAAMVKRVNAAIQAAAPSGTQVATPNNMLDLLQRSLAAAAARRK